ncbi:PTS glucose transporter subunit IIABC, partial [Mycoplasmopsis pullorum]
GFINRLLIPFGLHHIPNNLFWFQLGSHPTGEGEKVVNGDIFIFLNGVAKDNPGGIFQAGFFPMMMFG